MKWQVTRHICLAAGALFCLSVFAGNASAAEMSVSVNRSELIALSKPVDEVVIANPAIADVYVHGATRVSIIGKSIGSTNLRIFDREGELVKDLVVNVTYDLPAIRKVLRSFFPHDNLGVSMVNNNLALTGEVPDAETAEKAVRVVSEFLQSSGQSASGSGASSGDKGIINLAKIRSGQQVMLRVRIGEIQRTTLRNIGMSLDASRIAGNSIIGFTSVAAGGGFGSLGASVLTPNTSLTAILDALEEQSLLKILAEPNIVAISGEQAEFISGGEFPVPSWSGGNDSDNERITVEFRKYGISVQFMPIVLSANRIRLVVQPEVTEPTGSAFEVFGFPIRSLSTRKVNTTVELAPGESFMLAGLISDHVDANVESIPGVSEVPVLSAFFRGTSYERTETELVIAVTPYLVDPMAGTDLRLPSDNYQPPSSMEMFFYGALSAISNDSIRISQTPSLEGPVGFMVD